MAGLGTGATIAKKIGESSGSLPKGRNSGGNPTLESDVFSPEVVSSRTIDSRKLYGYQESGKYPGSLKHPEATGKSLKNIIKQMYKGDKSLTGVLGTGSTADAARWEYETGELFKGTNHLDNKAPQLINSLNTWIKKNPSASPSDLHAAKEMLKDLKKAWQGELND